MAGGANGAGILLARAAQADFRTLRRREAMAADLFLPDDARLDDRSRSAATALLAAQVACVEQGLREHAARLLATRGEPLVAERLANRPTQVLPRLIESGMPRDGDFIDELFLRVRIDLLDAALPVAPIEGAERPSMLARLIHSSDPLVASAALALMAAESSRRAASDHERLTVTGLPFALHRKLVWWVAAAIRDEFVGGSADHAATDQALLEAARRSIEAHDEDDRAESAALRLATAIQATPDELPFLIGEALRDRRLSVAIALVAHALDLDPRVVAHAVLDTVSDRLWLMLRAIDLPRDAMAGFGFALFEADPARDVETLPDLIEAAMAVPVDTARAAIAPLRFDPDFRSALATLNATRRAA